MPDSTGSWWQRNRTFVALSVGLFILNLIQAWGTPVIGDEAYYAAYSRQLDWGFFDHPPMVAGLIWLGSTLFSKALGLRLFTALLNALLPALLWQLVPEQTRQRPKAVWWWFGLLLCIPVFNLYGAVTTPDVPLLFFGTLYLIAFQRFQLRQRMVDAVLLGLAAALVLYSKYHGGILILLSFLLSPSLLLRPGTYVAGATAVVGLLPHILWQFNNEFITFDYHLNQRTGGNFRIDHVTGYVGGMLGVLNPAIVGLLLWLRFKRGKFSDAQNAFYFRLFLGLIGFFFLYSFRDRIEAHWVAVALLPLCVLLFNIATENTRVLKWIVLSSVGLLLLARVAVVMPITHLIPAFHDTEVLFAGIEQMADEDETVAFVNSYKNAALYTFHTGKEATTVTFVPYRQSQYSLSNQQEAFHNERVLLVGNWESRWMQAKALESDA